MIKNQKLIDLLHKYEDVNVWLGQLSHLPTSDFTDVTNEAMNTISVHLKIPPDTIRNIILMENDNYNEQIETVLIFYYEYFRKTPAFRQWIATQ